MGENEKKEEKIVRELIRNPRISDNQIAKKTGIPLKTVNRKRKALEQMGLINYFTCFDNSPRGTGAFNAMHMYFVKFRLGITRKQVTDFILKDIPSKQELKHVRDAYVGDSDGNVIVIFVIESRVESDIVEIFNAEIVPKFAKAFGNDAINRTKKISLEMPVRIMHNYIPKSNTSNGRIRDDWPDDLIFVE